MQAASEILDVIGVCGLAHGRWEQQGRGNRGTIEGDALDRRPLGVEHEEIVQGLNKVIAAVSAGKHEYGLTPFCDRAICLPDMLDELVRTSSAPIKDGGGHRIERRELAKTSLVGAASL